MRENFAVYDFPCGRLKITYSDGAITRLEKTDLLSPGVPSEISEEACRQLREYFAGQRFAFDLPVKARGTPFQEKVWSELCRIPYGETRSYKEIAIKIGDEKACRAVGMANNRNPISIIIPCHRVIGATGALVGYGGGLEMKKLLLALERTNKPSV